MNRLLFILGLLLLLTHYVYTNDYLPTGFVVREVKEQGNIQVYFCPQDNCNETLVILVSDDMYCAFYDLKLEEIRSLTKNLVEHNRKYGLMHNKFCIINHTTVWTGSMSPTRNGNEKNNNNVVVITSPTLAKNYLEEWEELNKGIFGKGKKTKHTKISLGETKLENYFCPDDDCQKAVLNVLEEAEESIYFMIFTFTDAKIGDLLVRSTLDVRGVLEARQRNVQGSQYEKVKELVILDNNPQTMHHKVFIVDNKTVVTGSWNPTKAGSTKNDENILVIRDEKIAKEYVEEFNNLY